MKAIHLITTAVFAALVSPLAAADRVFEGPLDPFLGEPRMELQHLFKNERFPNIVVTLKGTVVATWGSKHIRSRRSEDGGKTWGDEFTIANPSFHGGGTTVDERSGDILVYSNCDSPRDAITGPSGLVLTVEDHGR